MCWIRHQALGNEHQLTWNSASQAVHKICFCHIVMTVDLPILLKNLTKFVNFQGSVKDSPTIVSCYLRFFYSLIKSVYFGSLHSKILKLKPLVDIWGSEGYDSGRKKKVEIIKRGFFEERNVVYVAWKVFNCQCINSYSYCYRGFSSTLVKPDYHGKMNAF